MNEFDNLKPEEVKNLFHYAPVALAKVSPDGSILDCNNEWCQLLEYSRSEMQRMSWQDITPGMDEKTMDSENVMAVIRGEQPFYNMLKTVRTKTGNDIRVWLRAIGNHNESGEFLYFWSYYKPHVELDNTVFVRNPKTGKDIPDVLKVCIAYAKANPKVTALLIAFIMGGPTAVRQVLMEIFPELIK